METIKIEYDEETKELINETYHFINSRKRQIIEYFLNDCFDNKEDVMIAESKAQSAIAKDILIKHLHRNLVIIQTIKGKVTINHDN